MRRVYERDGALILERVLRVLRDAYESSPKGFDQRLIQGLGLVLTTYSVIEDEVLVRGLASERHGFHGVHRRAEDYRERLGRKVPECVAAAVVDIYNSQTGKKGTLVVRHVTIFVYGHGLQRAIIDESQHRTPERLIMAQH